MIGTAYWLLVAAMAIALCLFGLKLLYWWLSRGLWNRD